MGRPRRRPTSSPTPPTSRSQPELVDVPDGGPVTPMGKRRSKDGVTESDEIAYKPPPLKALEKGKADPGPDMKDRDATSGALLESLRHFGVEARLLGVVSGPHVSRYELQLAPGTKVSQGRAAQGRPRLRARLDRHPHPGPDPGQEGGRGRGSEPAPPPRPPRRHLRRSAQGLLAASVLARQGRLRAVGQRRSCADAAHPRRRYDRRR